MTTLPWDILLHITGQLDDYKDFTVATSTCKELYHNGKYLGSTLQELCKNGTYTSKDTLTKSDIFVKCSRRVREEDSISSAVEVCGIPIIILLSAAVCEKDVRLVEIILRSKHWKGYVTGNKYAKLMLSLSLIDAVYNGDSRMTTRLIQEGAYVNVEGYKAMRVAFDLEHVHLYDILLERLLAQSRRP